jgi:mannose-1-phosphate guanylyltransferase/mannose-6-phosphate isomerase
VAGPPLHAVVLAGGAGERFWPASRARLPKPFLRVVAGRTLLDATLARARRLAGPDRVWVVCGAEHARAVRFATGLPPSRVLVEPERRNTAMAVGFAALRIAAQERDAIQVVLPADHVIPDARAFQAAVRRAAAAAAGQSVLVTLGVEPTRPETGYGYIRLGAAQGGAWTGLFRVRRFVEKPDAARARRWLRRGGHLWNSGIFVWSVGTILDEIERCSPAIHASLAALRRAAGSPRGAAALARAYRSAPALPIDRAVLEQSERVWCLPVEFHWSDVGTWESLAEELGVGEDVTRVIGGEVLLDDARGNLVWARDRLVALLGVEGLVVVDAGDALLVTRLERSSEVRRIVARLRDRGRSELL